MIVILKPNISKKDVTVVVREIRRLGSKPHVIHGVERRVIGAIGDERTHHTLETLITFPQVESVIPVQKRYKLVSRLAHPANSIINVRGTLIGGEKIHLQARPLSVDTEKSVLNTPPDGTAAGRNTPRV